MDAWVASLTEASSSAWVYPLLFAAVLADAFLVVVPSEVAVASLGALAASTGEPFVAVIVPVAALGALTGDLLCYLVGRTVGLERWRWQRTGRIGAAIARLQTTVQSRPALLIFTARYIPFARIAVNLSIGAARLPLARYLPLAAAAGLFWALYNVGIGTVFGNIFRDQPLLAILFSTAVAIALGLLVDRCVSAVRVWSRRRARRGEEAPRPAA